jgi:hypothetical protein
MLHDAQTLSGFSLVLGGDHPSRSLAARGEEADLDPGQWHDPRAQTVGTLAVPEQNEAYLGRLTIEVAWLPTNASWLDQIEIWFSVLQRKLLQPNHFLSTDHLEQAILDAHGLLQPDG